MLYENGDCIENGLHDTCMDAELRMNEHKAQQKFPFPVWPIYIRYTFEKDTFDEYLVNVGKDAFENQLIKELRDAEVEAEAAKAAPRPAIVPEAVPEVPEVVQEVPEAVPEVPEVYEVAEEAVPEVTESQHTQPLKKVEERIEAVVQALEAKIKQLESQQEKMAQVAQTTTTILQDMRTFFSHLCPLRRCHAVATRFKDEDPNPRAAEVCQ